MRKWNDDLWLFTEEEYEELPDGVLLKSITGDVKTKGQDYIDMDTRGGHIAYGMTNTMIASQGREVEYKCLLWQIKGA